MPAPGPEQSQVIRRAAAATLLAGLAIMGLKFGVYALTNSAAVLSDALESILNVLAAAVLWFSIRLASRPADATHPYGHGKVEFMTAGIEGWMIFAAGLGIAALAVKRLFVPEPLPNLTLGIFLLAATNLLNGGLAWYVYRTGKRFSSPAMVADGKHLATDFASTAGVVVGLVLVRFTGQQWLDPAVALVLAALILATSWDLLRQSIDGLMDRIDPADHAQIIKILDEEVHAGRILSYHKVRLRHYGAFHWIDMHLQVDPQMTVQDSHALASEIEYRIEQAFAQGGAKASAHVEPYVPVQGPPGRAPPTA